MITSSSSPTVGTGRAQSGVDDSGRTTLRDELQRSSLGGVTPANSRIAARASFAGQVGSAVQVIAEVGLIARVGAGAEFLAAYGAVSPATDAYAVVAPGVSTVLAAAVEVRRRTSTWRRPRTLPRPAPRPSPG